jgi:hypothetical protein
MTLNVKWAAILGFAVAGGAMMPGCTVREQTTVVERRPHHVVVADPYAPQPVYVAPAPTVVYPQPAPVVVTPTPAPVVVPPPAASPVVVTPTPVVAEPAPAVIVVRRPPPAVIVERVGPPPGPRYMWVQGYWAAQRGDWAWVRGHWEVPPRVGAVWVAPRYEAHGSEFHFSLGFWK